MIHKWEFEDGTTVRWTDKGSVLVAGRTPLAERVRAGVELGSPVDVGMAPGGDVPLDLLSAWLMNLFLEQQARRVGVQLETSTYAPTDADIPVDAAAILARDAAWAEQEPDPDAIY